MQQVCQATRIEGGHRPLVVGHSGIFPTSPQAITHCHPVAPVIATQWLLLLAPSGMTSGEMVK